MAYVKHSRIKRSVSMLAVCLLISPITNAQTTSPELSYFTGETKLACEALLCLSSSAGKGEAACAAGLSHYFDIKERKWSDTLAARIDFLNQCPDVQRTAAMSDLARVLTNGAGRCDAQTLNSELGSVRVDGNGAERSKISNVLPSHCYAYAQHSYTDVEKDMPRYVGVPGSGGRWVDPKNYEAWVKNQGRTLQ